MYKKKNKEPLCKFPRIPTTTEPTSLILPKQEVTDIINTLPSYGIISYEASTSYWYIKLPPEWQQATTKTLNRLYDTYHSHAWYKESVKLAQCWSNLVNTANNTSSKADTYTSTCKVNLVAPSSVVGLHISLGVWPISDSNLPQSLVESKKVQFTIGDIISFRSMRETPQNICGQYTDEYNFRYYPTRWLFVEIAFVDFEFPTRYPPHISIACIAVQLKVDKVDKFEIEYKRYKDKQIEVTNKATSTQTAQTCTYKISVFMCLCIFMLLLASIYVLNTV